MLDDALVHMQFLKVKYEPFVSILVMLDDALVLQERIIVTS